MREIREIREIRKYIPNAQCPMPNAQPSNFNSGK
jgi:chemotaxis signal transduction protein